MTYLHKSLTRAALVLIGIGLACAGIIAGIVWAVVAWVG